MQVWFPKLKDKFILQSDWTTKIYWDKNNLVFLREINMTGQRRVKDGMRIFKDEFGNIVRNEDNSIKMEQKFRNETVANPLFRDDTGRYAPVSHTFETGMKFTISKFNTGYNGRIHSIYLKILTASDKKLINKNVEIKFDDFMGVDIEIINDEE